MLVKAKFRASIFLLFLHLKLYTNQLNGFKIQQLRIIEINKTGLLLKNELSDNENKRKPVN